MDSIIFDVDGTLWDSTEIVARSWTDYLKTEGIFMEITSQRLMQLFGQLRKRAFAVHRHVGDDVALDDTVLVRNTLQGIVFVFVEKFGE